MVGEPLPTDDTERPLRTGLLAAQLVGDGDEVVWWASTFDHNYKKRRFTRSTAISPYAGLQLQLLDGPTYRRNISLSRLRNHRAVAREFARLAPTQARPDAIVCSLPTIELTIAAAQYARETGVPIIFDIRDLHPDVYLDLLPRPLRPVGRALLRPLYRKLRNALRTGASLFAIGPSFLDWGVALAGRSKRATDRVFGFGYPELEVSSDEWDAAGVRLRALGVDPHSQIVWFLGTFNRWIDLHPVLDAARKLSADRTKFQFVISGAGDRQHEWRTSAAGLDNVVFTGWITAPEIKWLSDHAWAALAAYSSRFHGFGNKVTEYMAAGLPILLSIGGDAAELVKRHQCGEVYAPGSDEPLEHILRRWATNPAVRNRLATNSRAAYDRHYSAAIVYGEMASHIRAVARGAA
jgi:glycosyltransferase involved in cell wall biosynthesis